MLRDGDRVAEGHLGHVDVVGDGGLEVDVVGADARRDGEIIRGEADAERNSIFADAFGEDPEFFEFYRSLTAYKNALQGKNSTMVISPDSEFFDYLKSDIGLK